jgi:hypothetical protein
LATPDDWADDQELQEQQHRQQELDHQKQVCFDDY